MEHLSESHTEDIPAHVTEAELAIPNISLLLQNEREEIERVESDYTSQYQPQGSWDPTQHAQSKRKAQ